MCALKARTGAAAAPKEEETAGTTNAGPTAVAHPGNPADTLVSLNPYLSGLEGMGEGDGKSRISIDGSEFLYKKLEFRTPELFIPGDKVTNGVKYWQWWPARNDQGEQVEDGQMCMSYDHKTSVDGIPCNACPHFRDKSCKLRYELTFDEWDDSEMADQSHTLTMSLTSAYAFIDYVRALSAGNPMSPKDAEFLKKPIDARKPATGANVNLYTDPKTAEVFNPGRPVGLHEVVTRVIVQRVSATNKKSGQKIMWGQCCFQAIGFVDYNA